MGLPGISTDHSLVLNFGEDVEYVTKALQNFIHITWGLDDQQ